MIEMSFNHNFSFITEVLGQGMKMYKKQTNKNLCKWQKMMVNLKVFPIQLFPSIKAIVAVWFKVWSLFRSWLKPTQGQQECRVASVTGAFPGFLTVMGLQRWPSMSNCPLPESLVPAVILAVAPAKEYSHPFPETRASLHTCCCFCCFSFAAWNNIKSNFNVCMKGTMNTLSVDF